MGSSGKLPLAGTGGGLGGGALGGGNGSNGRRTLCAAGGSDGGSGSGGLWGKYLHLLETNPFVTRAVTCAVLNGLGEHHGIDPSLVGPVSLSMRRHAGDVFCQLVIEKGNLNLERALTFTTLGLVFVGPTLYFWYNWLGAAVPGSGIASILGSLALDQLLFAPVFIAAFMSIITVGDCLG